MQVCNERFKSFFRDGTIISAEFVTLAGNLPFPVDFESISVVLRCLYQGNEKLY